MKLHAMKLTLAVEVSVLDPTRNVSIRKTVRFLGTCDELTTDPRIKRGVNAAVIDAVSLMSPAEAT